MKGKFQNLSGYVLAGGKSSRMGEDKAFLEIGGVTFLERAAETFSKICETRVKIAINHSQAENFRKNFPAFEFVFDIFPERGAVGGIHAALKDCRTEFAAVLAVDLPLVTSETVERLAQIALNAKTAAVVPTQTDGKLQPLCAIYRAEDCLPVIENLINRKSSVAVREFLARVSYLSVDQKELSPDEEIFFNVNRPTDFASLT